MTIWSFLGPPLGTRAVLPPWHVGLIFGSRHTFRQVSTDFQSRTGPNFTPYDFFFFFNSTLLNMGGFTQLCYGFFLSPALPLSGPWPLKNVEQSRENPNLKNTKLNATSVVRISRRGWLRPSNRASVPTPVRGRRQRECPEEAKYILVMLLWVCIERGNA